MDKERQEEIINLLTSKGVVQPCPRCLNPQFELAAERSRHYNSEGCQSTSWRFKATCGHVKQTAKALARRLCAGFFVAARLRAGVGIDG